jgi:hypothetical protein
MSPDINRLSSSLRRCHHQRITRLGKSNRFDFEELRAIEDMRKIFQYFQSKKADVLRAVV